MTYADGFNVRTTSGTLTSIGDALDGLLAATTIATSDGTQTISSTSLTDLTGMSQAVTVAAGETVLIYLEFKLGIHAAAKTAEWKLLRDATSLALRDLLSVTTDEQHWITVLYIDKPGAGTYTYKAQLRDATDTTAVYATYRRFVTVKLQES